MGVNEVTLHLDEHSYDRCQHLPWDPRRGLCRACPIVPPVLEGLLLRLPRSIKSQNSYLKAEDNPKYLVRFQSYRQASKKQVLWRGATFRAPFAAKPTAAAVDINSLRCSAMKLKTRNTAYSGRPKNTYEWMYIHACTQICATYA